MSQQIFELEEQRVGKQTVFVRLTRHRAADLAKLLVTLLERKDDEITLLLNGHLTHEFGEEVPPP